MWALLKTLLAAIITVTLLFLAVVIYQYTTYAPAPPPQANCQPLQLLTHAQQPIEAHLYRCQRGDQQWSGYEVWLLENVDQHWQRLLTASASELPKTVCMQLVWQRDNVLQLQHTGSNHGYTLSNNQFTYRASDGRKHGMGFSANNNDALSCAW
ncbi:hypothetical protein [Idiomarina xiamenensis]|uniref:Uncharacterized protein n=1 Tax=Idiomarina xiamenensis 10-D-4 TaxID=740709 RepID=K2KWI1_9GAMM|nr:hypothetical protein [Idiomarina xiamenensis]EKE86834.1 hypothetical protein A10D4_01292 [Idiomarina xiamenensis 10-D-4]